jgi:hypothetical protein
MGSLKIESSRSVSKVAVSKVAVSKVAVSVIAMVGSAVGCGSTPVEAAGKKDPGVLVTDRNLSEISGCGVSSINPGIIWVHNDSGDAARAYAVDSKTGNTVFTVSLKDVEANDIEDMTLYNGRIYLADIGDNGSSRKNVRIQSFVEPKIPVAKAGNGKPSVKVTAKTRKLTYEGGSRDAEAFFVDSDGMMVVVDKATGRVFRAGSDDVLRPVASTNLALVTGASRTVDGRTVLLRTYFAVFRYTRAATAGFDDVWKSEPSTVEGPFLPQAEAICVEPDGTAAWTVSEGQGGSVRFYRMPLVAAK